MTDSERREAWVTIPTPEARAAKSTKNDPYNFGFAPAMGGLIASHPEIGSAFRSLYAKIMFSPDSSLSRAEREMTASVAAAAQDCFY